MSIEITNSFGHVRVCVYIYIYIYGMEYFKNHHEYDQNLFYGIYTRFLMPNVEAIKKFAYLEI